MIKLIRVCDALPDMIIADNFFDEGGRILLSKGIRLTSALIQSLIKRDIDQVCIVINDAGSNLDTSNINQLHERLDQIFKQTEHLPANLQLKEYLSEYYAEKIG
ncbi:hypothetical protein [Undibacterium sp. RuTC16W]|uniref:hypothetical protein n=1 Tax=Undibacterium sp. RuTC16W TaxID=3413048 RepID=UPI003BF42167